jgi:hypothetical protein
MGSISRGERRRSRREAKKGGRPEWGTLEEFARLRIQGWLQDLLEEEITEHDLLLKMGAPSLGAPALDVIANEAPDTSVCTAYAVTSGGSSRVHCTEFPAGSCVLAEVAAGTGRKLVCKNGVADPRCRAQ